MREIKFRAHLKDINKIVKVEAIDWDEKENLLSFTCQGKDYLEGKNYFEDKDDIVLMQYTGHKDMNGKEIYVSDVVKYRNNPYQVKWIFLDFYIHQINGRGLKLLDEFETNVMDIEVIGNIYENPELFK